MSKYRWIKRGSVRLYNVGILADGTLYNPRGYPDALVRALVLAADEAAHVARIYPRTTQAIRTATNRYRQRSAKLNSKRLD
jgi:hypothetical protein